MRKARRERLRDFLAMAGDRRLDLDRSAVRRRRLHDEPEARLLGRDEALRDAREIGRMTRFARLGEQEPVAVDAAPA
jgi:hypothetical protein